MTTNFTQHNILLALFLATLKFTLTAQEIVINEMVSSNSVVLDEDNESPDWIELYNRSDSNINLQGWYISDNADSLLKWEFPNATINAGQTLLVYASGKDRKSMTQYETIINWGDVWQYAIGSDEIPSHWNTSTFDASAWETGASGFGYGDDDDETLLEEGTLSVFIRKTINIENLNNISELFLHIDYDDGFVAYINGNEVARENLGTPNTEVSWNQYANDYTEPLISQGLPPAEYNISDYVDYLVEGENIIAIQIHNSSATSSDLTLIPFLTLGYNSNVEISNAPPEIINLKNGNLHTNFKINAEGENLFLSRPSGTLEFTMDSIPLVRNISFGQKPDGSGDFFYFLEPTPGALNTTQGYSNMSENDLNYSEPAGIYSSPISISIESASGAAVYYTTDGSDPNNNSTFYNGEIEISEPTTIKAVAIKDDLLPSKPKVASYVISDRELDLPVVSLSTDPYNLFDYYYGIYEMGPNAESNSPHFGANFWQDWERPVYFEYFDKNGNMQLSTNAGIKIFGAYSRANDQKSFALFARKEYDAKSFDYKFFEEKDIDQFKSLVLRNSGNDWNQTAIRDGLNTTLATPLNIDKQAFQPTIVYLNGEYWGILNLREKVNEDFLEANHKGVDADKVDILEINAQINEGSNTDYLEMIDFIESHTLATEANYLKVTKQMDIDNFIDYQVTQIYINNQDWPGNNIKYWRPQTNNGKWRWILYDTDFGYNLWDEDGYKENTLQFATASNGPSWPNPPWSTFLLRELLKNKTFETSFINAFADHMNTAFKTSNMHSTISELKSNIEDEIPYHNDRWNHLWNWDENIGDMVAYAYNRTSNMRYHIEDYFSLSGHYTLSLLVANQNEGYIQVNSICIKDKTWSGIYFKDNPVTITAIAKPGYRFSHWLGSNEPSATIVNSFDEAISLEAVFEAADKPNEAVVINEINYKSADSYNTDDWIELYNTTQSNIDISGWIIRDLNPSDAYTIPKGTKIAPLDYLVVCKDFEKFDIVHPTISNRIGNFDFGLSSSDDFIMLFNSQGDLMDSVFYSSASPWPKPADGEGATLALINPYIDNSIYNNWQASDLNNGTPGRHNDGFNNIDNNTIIANRDNVELSAYPNPFSNSTNVTFLLQRDAHVSVEIMDYKGATITKLASKDFMAGEYQIPWNGITADGNEVPSGLYLVKIVINQGTQKVHKIMLNK